MLQFRGDGVTHVFDAGLLFYENAQSQGYHPRYAIDDYVNTPNLLTQNVQANQLTGSMGVGYQPFNEVPSPADPTSGAAACRSTMATEQIVAKDTFQLSYELAGCDELHLMQALATRGGGFSAQQFAAGSQSIGSSFVPSLTYASTITGSHHDGASQVRTFAYSASCSCFAYSTGPS